MKECLVTMIDMNGDQPCHTNPDPNYCARLDNDEMGPIGERLQKILREYSDDYLAFALNEYRPKGAVRRVKRAKCQGIDTIYGFLVAENNSRPHLPPIALPPSK